MTRLKRRIWLESSADPINAAIMSMGQVVAWFIVHGERHGYPMSRADVRDAALIAAVQLTMQAALCVGSRFVLSRWRRTQLAWRRRRQRWSRAALRSQRGTDHSLT
jgi:hypothetical protein